MKEPQMPLKIYQPHVETRNGVYTFLCKGQAGSHFVNQIYRILFDPF